MIEICFSWKPYSHQKPGPQLLSGKPACGKFQTILSNPTPILFTISGLCIQFISMPCNTVAPLLANLLILVTTLSLYSCYSCSYESYVVAIRRCIFLPYLCLTHQEIDSENERSPSPTVNTDMLGSQKCSGGPLDQFNPIVPLRLLAYYLLAYFCSCCYFATFYYTFLLLLLLGCSPSIALYLQSFSYRYIINSIINQLINDKRNS